MHLFTYVMKVMFLDAAPSLMPFAATNSEKPSSAADSASTSGRAGKEGECEEEWDICVS